MIFLRLIDHLNIQCYKSILVLTGMSLRNLEECGQIANRRVITYVHTLFSEIVSEIVIRNSRPANVEVNENARDMGS